MCEKTATHFAKIEKVIPSENVTCQTGNKCYQMPGNQVSGNLEKLYNGLRQMPNGSGILWGVSNFQVENTVILLPFFYLSFFFFFSFCNYSRKNYLSRNAESIFTVCHELKKKKQQGVRVNILHRSTSQLALLRM